MGKPELIVIAGPTASGKTALAVRLCQRIDGEVISADSMQIYRGMDIGTAKPDKEEMGGIRHHLLSIVEPDERFSAAAYRETALKAIENVRKAGKRPVLCGGTGLYIDALTRPMGFGQHVGNNELRSTLMTIAEEDGGKERLHQMLAEVDSESARRLHVNDVRRVIRAIEVYRMTGHTIGEQARFDRQHEDTFIVKMFALNWPREKLYERINRRVDEMMARGLQQEVQELIDRGFLTGSTASQALGYKEIAAALRGETTLEAAVDAIKQGSRHYAKRQMTWFRRDERVHWIDPVGRTLEDIVDEIIKECGLFHE